MASNKVEYTRLEQLHKTSVIVSVILAGLSIGLIKHGSFSLSTGFLTKDELLSNPDTVLAPAVRTLLDVNLDYALAAVLLLNALLHGLIVMRWRKTYTKGLKNRASAWRWINTALIMGLLVELVGMMVGIRDLFVLKTMGLSTLVGFALCYGLERTGAKPKNPPKAIFWTAATVKALPWVLILSSIIGTSLFGLERLGWHVYASAAVLLFAFVVGGRNLWRSLTRQGLWADYHYVEQQALQLSIVSLAVIAGCMIIGLR